MAAVECVVSKMRSAQMGVIIRFVSCMDVAMLIIMPVIQIMDVQPGSLCAQQRQAEQQAPQQQYPFVYLAKRIHHCQSIQLGKLNST